MQDNIFGTRQNTNGNDCGRDLCESIDGCLNCPYAVSDGLVEYSDELLNYIEEVIARNWNGSVGLTSKGGYVVSYAYGTDDEDEAEYIDEIGAEIRKALYGFKVIH